MPADADTAKVEWAPGEVPVSPRYGDSYYAKTDGLAESRHVFLAGNRLETRLAAGGEFRIAELGFGTGLNFCAALDLWVRVAPAGARLHFTSFEAATMAPDDMARALGRWPEIEGIAACLLSAWGQDVPRTDPGSPTILQLDSAELTIVQGDARQTLPAWKGTADAWFLDGFAPARNPEMWEESLLAEVFAKTAPGGTFATYSAAGRVRRGLEAAGFDVHRLLGFGTKREMLAGER